ncbi:hypothetical protein COC58_00640 [Bacillus cereus]|uniref:hypothetical protein n=1 Tax=Bacillus mobilis TaxID=2026190 RepID=UPI000BFB9CB1|nr:hypothetical protein COC58_00640 [Bacillus cereus]
MGFRSDVIEVGYHLVVIPFFVVGMAGLVVNEIYSGDYSNISTFRQKTTTIANLILNFEVS